ncbi:MAG: hypothetical protein HZB25_08325 [Candidatus Eisenbacteria bacterium]|nr:hypothetical protein [Candidatus Eisenbacteria bacterium]
MTRYAAMMVVLLAALCLAFVADSCESNRRVPGHPVSRAGAEGADAGLTPAVIRADMLGSEALRAIEDEGRREAMALRRSLLRAPDGSDRRALEQAARELRRETQARLLETQAGVARLSGDEEAARQAEHRLQLMQDPASRGGAGPPAGVK